MSSLIFQFATSIKEWELESWGTAVLCITAVVLIYFIIANCKSKQSQLLIIPSSRKILLISVPAQGKWCLGESSNLSLDNDIATKYELIKCSQLELDNNNKIKETIQTEYKKSLSTYGHLINDICLVFEYEDETNLCLKIDVAIDFFKHFKQLLRIIITNLSLSDDPEAAQVELLRKFSLLNVTENQIKFVKGQIDNIQLISACYIFDTKETLFEVTSREQDQQVMKELAIQINQRQHQYSAIEQNEV